MDNNYNYQQANEVNTVGTEPNTTLYIILSIVELICCCRTLGIISLIFAILAESSKKSGDMNDANSKCKISMILIIVGFAVAILSIIATIVITVLFPAAFASFFTMGTGAYNLY